MKRSSRLSAVIVGLCTLLLLGSASLYATEDGINGLGVSSEVNITAGEVEGEAYSVLVDVALAGGRANVKVGPVPHAKLYPNGGMDVSTLSELDLLGIVSSKSLFNVSTGGTTSNSASSESVSTVEDLNIFNGLIKVEALTTFCSSSTDGETASSEAGSRILGLKIADQTLDILAPANTSIDLINLTLKQDGIFAAPYLLIELMDASGGVLSSTSVLVKNLTDTVQQLLDKLLGDLVQQLVNTLFGGSELPIATLTLNEQISGGNGTTSSSMSNSAIHLHINTDVVELLDLGLQGLQVGTGDIYIAATKCGVDIVTMTVPCPTCPDCNCSECCDQCDCDPDCSSCCEECDCCEPCPVCDDTGFMTGGGTIGHETGDDFASFGFNAHPAGKNKGHINVVDHEGSHYQGNNITAFDIDGDCATFAGAAQVDNANGYTYEATACDYGEPGIDVDTFSFTVKKGQSVVYHNEGVLTGGNNQMH
jgi:hypothetical protein